jgi:hypothetical protein
VSDENRIPTPLVFAVIGLLLGWSLGFSGGAFFLAGFGLGLLLPALSDAVRAAQRNRATRESRSTEARVAAAEQANNHQAAAESRVTSRKEAGDV